MRRASFVIYAEEEDLGSILSDLIGRTGRGKVVASVSHELSLKEALAQHEPDALLVGLSHDAHQTLDCIEPLKSIDAALFVAGPHDNSALLRRALKLGVKEFFATQPEVGELDSAIEELLVSRPPTGSHGREAPILAVMGAKGGVGATFVACQLAASLQRAGGNTTIVDLNCPLGDVALQLDLEPRYTLASVLQQTDDFDGAFLENLLEEHGSGLHVLAAPARVEENELVRGGHVEQVLSLLRQQMDWVIVDVARSWNEASVCALDRASEILLVTSGDLAALAHTREHVELLRRLGHAEERIHLIVNRRAPGDAVSRDELKKFLDGRSGIELPNDYQRALEAINGGRTLADLAPRAELTRAFDELARTAHDWCGIDAGDVDHSQGGLGSRVRKLFRR